MGKVINDIKLEISTVEINEIQHHLPGITVKYRFDYTNLILQIFVNNCIVSTFTDNLATIHWHKINGKGMDFKKLLTVEMIITWACEATEIENDDIFLHTRKGEIVFARQMAMAKIYVYLIPNFRKVGELFGGFSHATVLHAKSAMEKELKYFSPEQKSYLNKFNTKLNSVLK